MGMSVWLINRVLATALVAGLATAGSFANAKPLPVALSIDSAAPLLVKGKGRVAAEQLKLKNWKVAQKNLVAYLKTGTLTKKEIPRIKLLIAVTDARLGYWKRAAQGFVSLLHQLPHLRDYIHYQAARAYYFAKLPTNALAQAEAVSDQSIHAAESELLIGDILRGQGRPAAVANHYREYLTRWPRGMRRNEARFRLAAALEKQGQFREAIQEYKKISIAGPLTQWANSARPRIKSLLKKIPTEQRNNLTQWTAAEFVKRGMAYYKAMRNPLSAADFSAARKAPKLTPDLDCIASYHEANSWFKERNRTKSAPLFDQALKSCRKANNTDLQVKSAYQAGRSYARLRQHKVAARRYATAETIAPTHSYADDARLRQAEEYQSLNNQTKVTALLRTIPSRYPTGDMRAEAMWRLAWRAYKNKKYRQTAHWLKKQIEVMPIASNYWAEGQAQYWLGRTAEKQKRPKSAIRYYTSAIRKYPLSYYALLALNRLLESHPTHYTKLTTELNNIAPPPPLHFRPRGVYLSPGFRRVLEFLKLGLGTPAEAELRKLGFRIPSGKKPVRDPDQIDKLWAMAFLNNRAGRVGAALWVTRWHVQDYKRHWPTGDNPLRWNIAYPKPYWRLVSQYGERYQYPPPLQIAIMREESGFNPLLESYANAIGLTQMIFPTARRFGKGTGIEINRKNLRDPEKNIHIGGRFLSFLLKKWENHLLLVIPSYNAGEGATARWLRARGDWQADEWLEAIPADQPRRYSKRVLSSYFAYAYMTDGTIPKISNTIPKRLIKTKRSKKKNQKKNQKKRGKKKPQKKKRNKK